MSDPVAYRIKDYADGWILQETLTDSERAICAEQGNVVQALVPADRITALENENAELRQMATRVVYDAKLTDVFGNGAKHYIVTPYLLDALRSALGDGGGE